MFWGQQNSSHRACLGFLWADRGSGHWLFSISCSDTLRPPFLLLRHGCRQLAWASAKACLNLFWRNTELFLLVFPEQELQPGKWKWPFHYFPGITMNTNTTSCLWVQRMFWGWRAMFRTYSLMSLIGARTIAPLCHSRLFLLWNHRAKTVLVCRLGGSCRDNWKTVSLLQIPAILSPTCLGPWRLKVQVLAQMKNNGQQKSLLTDSQRD